MSASVTNCISDGHDTFPLVTLQAFFSQDLGLFDGFFLPTQGKGWWLGQIIP